MSKFPLISIIMPVYNAQPFLDDAILSILNQSYSNFEFIIIDDKSTDNSLSIIKKYQKNDSRIKILKGNGKNLVLITTLGCTKGTLKTKDNKHIS